MSIRKYAGKPGYTKTGTTSLRAVVFSKAEATKKAKDMRKKGMHIYIRKETFKSAKTNRPKVMYKLYSK